jgi:PAS domain S-box-containing protein
MKARSNKQTATSEKSLEQRLRFETLLAEISGRFVNLPADRIDGEIVDAQRRICECLRLDLATLWQWSMEDPRIVKMTHIYRPLGGPPLPEPMYAQEHFPWCQQQLEAGRIVAVSSIEDVPAEAARDQEVWRHLGIKAVLSFPLSPGGGPIIGALSFNTVKRERTWPEPLIQRIGLIARVFTNALIRKQADTALRESEMRLNLATEAVGAGLWIMNADSGKVWVSTKSRELFHFSPDEEIGYESYFKVIHPEDRDRVHQDVQRALRSGEKLHTDYRIVLPDGSVRWIAAYGQSYPQSAGAPGRLMGLSLDITDQKKNDHEMAQLRLELTHLTRVAVLNEMSASLAHEISQPLGAILFNAEAAKILLSQTPDKREAVPEIVDEIILDVKRAADVIRKVRGLVKKAETHFEPLSINDLIDDILALLRGSIAMNDVTIRLDLKPDLANIRGDRVRLQQVLMNLVMNALDAMKEVPPGILTVRSAMDGQGMVTVSVGDSGPGIAEAGRTLLFQPFFTTKKNGLGLGLSICRSIIEEHGGRIWEEDRPGGGAIFSFSLKAWKEEKLA